ncbi:MAG: ATP synthase subunit I [Xanthomonadales bacterium]|nr:ATP synthase subunit I [Xanthomonadales bacterium]
MKTALPLVLAQLLATLVAAVIGLFFSLVTAYSLLVGGLICVLPNAWFGLRLHLQAKRSSGNPEEDAGRFVAAAYKGEAIKLLMTGAFFALVFSQLQPLNVLALFGGYIICLLVNWASLIFIDRDPAEALPAVTKETIKDKNY